MNRKKLKSIRREMDRLRRSTQNASALESMAKRLGRKLVKRGKHPMWESTEFRALYPLSIPHHGGRDLPIGTKKSVLDQLEDDILAWEESLEREESEGLDENDVTG
jgi:hypothetical protein